VWIIILVMRCGYKLQNRNYEHVIIKLKRFQKEIVLINSESGFLIEEEIMKEK